MIFPHSSSPSWSTSSETQMWQFSTFWAFLDIIGPFLWLFIYCWAFWGQNFYLLGQFFCKYLFSPGCFFVDNWALFHSNQLVTLISSSLSLFKLFSRAKLEAAATKDPRTWIRLLEPPLFCFAWMQKKTSLTESFNQPFVSSVRATIKLQDLILDGTTCVDFFPSSRNFQMSWVFIKYAS